MKITTIDYLPTAYVLAIFYGIISLIKSIFNLSAIGILNLSIGYAVQGLITGLIVGFVGGLLAIWIYNQISDKIYISFK